MKQKEESTSHVPLGDPQIPVQEESQMIETCEQVCPLSVNTMKTSSALFLNLCMMEEHSDKL